MENSKYNDIKNTFRNQIFSVLPITKSTNVRKRDNGENILKLYLQFGYHLGLIPFKIGKNELDGTIFLESNKLQKVLPPSTYINCCKKLHTLF